MTLDECHSLFMFTFLLPSFSKITHICSVDIAVGIRGIVYPKLLAYEETLSLVRLDQYFWVWRSSALQCFSMFAFRGKIA